MLLLCNFLLLTCAMVRKGLNVPPSCSLAYSSQLTVLYFRMFNLLGIFA